MLEPSDLQGAKPLSDFAVKHKYALNQEIEYRIRKIGGITEFPGGACDLEDYPLAQLWDWHPPAKRVKNDFEQWTKWTKSNV